MRQRTLVGIATLAALWAPVLPAGAQDISADVRSWTGQSWSLAQPSLEVFYTVVPSDADGSEGEPPSAGPPSAPPPGASAGSGFQLFGSAEALSALFDRQQEPLQGHAEARFVTLSNNGVETRVPLASIDRLVFHRQPILRTTLPPYIADTHVRYSATAVLTDGSTVKGDYVNLGTAVLRGLTPQGRVEIPWTDIEQVQFRR